MIDLIFNHYNIYIDKLKKKICKENEEEELSSEIGTVLMKIIRSIESIFNDHNYIKIINKFLSNENISIKKTDAYIIKELPELSITITNFYINGKSVGYYTFNQLSLLSFKLFSQIDLKIYLPYLFPTKNQLSPLYTENDINNLINNQEEITIKILPIIKNIIEIYGLRYYYSTNEILPYLKYIF